MMDRIDDQAWRRDGCTDDCTVVVAFVPGRSGRERIEVHDPVAHEKWGAERVDSTSTYGEIVTGPLRISLARQQVTLYEREVVLTAGEWSILAYLARTLGTWTSTDALSVACWGERSIGAPDQHRMHMMVNRLRWRLEASAALIENRVGIGYRLRQWPPGMPVAAAARPWSREYPCCRDCGTTTRQHNGKGLCGICRQKVERKKRREPS